MTVRHGSVEKFHDDELIVAIPQLSVVREELQDFGVEIGDRGIEENGVLGLARLSELKDIEKAVRKLERDRSVGQEIKAYRKLRHEAHPDAPPVSDLALLIYGVKLRLARRYPGWQIAIGKNYRPSLVRGNPHTDGTGRPKPHTDGAGHPLPHTDPHTDGDGTPASAHSGFTGPILRPGPHTDGAGHPLPHTDPHTDGEGRPTTTGAIDPEAGDRELGRGVRVGLVDTKLFPHESLTGRYVGRAADILSPAQPVFTEFDGHCTFVASCILQQAPAATLYLRHVLDHRGDGTVWEAAAGIAELISLDLDVVNLSFGEYMTDDDSAPMVLDAAIRRFGRDTVVVAAAGNNGDVNGSRPSDVPAGVTSSTTSYPAALPEVVGVGAIDGDNKRAPFTPDPAPWISLLARGTDLNAAYLRGEVRLPHQSKTTRFDGIANWAGCSFAAGVVTGVIAARTEPGRRSARQALDELMGSLRYEPQPGLLIN
jgi:Subtilase family